MKTWITASLTFITAIASFSCENAFAVASPQPTRWPASASVSLQTNSSKRDMLQRLKTMQERHANEIASLETAIKKRLQDSMSLDVAKEDSKFSTAKTGLLAKKIEDLNKRRMELNARREIVDRLIFSIDSKYSNQPLQPFLEQQFLEMASTDLSEGRDSRMWKAYTYLSIAIREVPEPKEDMFAVIEGYMNFTSVLEPKTPAEYLATRNYTNGLESVAANPMDRSDAGDSAVDKNTSYSGPVPLALELNLRSARPQTVSAQATEPSTLSGTSQSASDSAPATAN